MERYNNNGGNSGIEYYEIGQDFITVWFKGGNKPYTYSYSSAGPEHIESMKELAIVGLGLNSYIMKNVRDKFER